MQLRKYLPFIIGLALVVSGCFALQAFAVNLISNPCFAGGSTSGWTLASPDYNVTTTNPYSGCGTGYTVNQQSTSGYNNFASSAAIPISANATYTLSFYYTMSSTQPTHLQINQYTEFGTNFIDVPVTSTAGAWTKTSQTFYSGSVTSTVIRFYNNNGTVTANYDDFDLEQSGVSTTVYRWQTVPIDGIGNMIWPSNLNASGTITASYTSTPNTYTSFRTWPTASIGLQNSYTGNLGCWFIVSQPLTVSALGRFYNASSSNNHAAYIWNDATQAMVASGTIFASTSTDSNSYKWVNLTSTATLNPGTPYSITIDETNGGDYWIDQTGLQAWNNKDYFQSVIYREGPTYTNATGTFPGAQSVSQSCHDAPAFKYTLQAIQQINANYNGSTTAGITSASNGAAILSGNTADDGVTIISPFPSITLQPSSGQTINPLTINGSVGPAYVSGATPDGTIIGGAITGAKELAPLESYTSNQGAPSLSSTSTDSFASCSTITTCLVFGNYSTSPYALWLQGERTTSDGSTWPISINPLGGNVGIGLSNPAVALQVSSTVRLGVSGVPGCLESYDSVNSTTLDYIYWSNAVQTVTTTKPSFCQ